MAASIPNVQTTDKDINQLQRNIQQALNPVLKNPILYGVVLKSVSLKVGSNTIAHGLGRTLQGWSLSRIRSQAQVFDTQDSNSSPDKTLLLNSDALVSVDIYVW